MTSIKNQLYATKKFICLPFGLPIFNISAIEQHVSFQFKTADYGIGAQGKLFMITETGKKFVGNFSNGLVKIDIDLEPLHVCVLEVIPD